MANSDIVTSAGKGAALTAGDHDQNMKSLAGIVEEITGAFTVDYQDQGKTILGNSISSIAVTLGTAASIAAAGDTGTFQITFKTLNIGVMTITRGGTDTIDGATSISLKTNDSITLQTNDSNDSWKIIARDMDVVDINGGTIDGATIGANSASTVKGSTLQGASGTTINEFSIDGIMAGNSDDAVPTEKAVKTYVGANTSTYATDTQALGTIVAGASSTYSWTHGLGTDDIDFGIMLDGPSDSVAEAIDPNGYRVSFIGGLASGANGQPSVPSSGRINVRVQNTSGSSSDYNVKLWARVR